MEILENGPKVLIRKYRYGDEKAIIRLVNEGTMVTVNPFFFRAATREMIVSSFLNDNKRGYSFLCKYYRLHILYDIPVTSEFLFIFRLRLF